MRSCSELSITKQWQGRYGVPLRSAPLLFMGIGSRHKTKGQIWLHHGPQHGVIGTARWQQKKILFGDSERLPNVCAVFTNVTETQATKKVIFFLIENLYHLDTIKNFYYNYYQNYNI
jgi:hypothetical protein